MLLITKLEKLLANSVDNSFEKFQGDIHKLLMYVSNKKGINFLFNGRFIYARDVSEDGLKEKVYGLHGPKIKERDAIIKVVGDLIGNDKSVEKFIKAYIKNENSIQLNAEEYDRFSDNNKIVNDRARHI